MAELTHTWKWSRLVPDIGSNRSLPNPFFLRVKSGLLVSEMQEFEDALKEMATKDPVAWAGLLGKYVEMGTEPLKVNGKDIATLADYLALLNDISGVDGMLELTGAVRWSNSVQGTKALFFQRASGGGAFTEILPTEKAATPGGAR